MKLSDYLNDINFQKNNLLRDQDADAAWAAAKDYNPWVINKALSFGIDTVMYADEMNRHYNLDKDMQYDYYIGAIRKKKRFNPWIKNENKTKDLIMVAKHFGINLNKAKATLQLLSEEQLEVLRKRMELY